jgi:hypothetical protein
MTMSQAALYSAGWMNSTIHDFLTGIDEPPDAMVFSLITCVDSCLDVVSLLETSPLLRGLASDARRVGKGASVETRRLLDAQRDHRIFYGFDEVWFFPQAPCEARPEEMYLTGPARLSARSLDQLDDLIAWMRRNDGQLGLGDGTGLNFLARLVGLGKVLVDQYAESADVGVPR